MMESEEYEKILKEKAELQKALDEMEAEYPDIELEANLQIAAEWIEALEEVGLPKNCGLWEV